MIQIKKVQNKLGSLISDHRLLITGMLLPAALLSGCMGIYEGGFECPAGKGVGCKSISDVNQMVDQGDLPERSSANLPQPYCKKCGALQDQEVDPKHQEKAKIWYPDWDLEKA